jgi:tetratricopeptide (TPR) repeat protein
MNGRVYALRDRVTRRETLSQLSARGLLTPTASYSTEVLHMTRPLTAVVLAFAGLVALLAVPLPGAKHETWFEARSPNFIVACNAGEKQARKTAIRFEQIRAVFRRELLLASKHESPVITILAVKDEESMKTLLPEYWVKGHAHPAGMFLDSMNQYFAAIQLDTPGANPYDTIYHEYFHSLTTPYYPNLPVWVSEGLAEFYGNTLIGDSEVGMGRPAPDLIAELKQGGLMPLDVLFKVDHNSPYYNESNKISVFYAESWALTHYLMVGDKSAHRAMLQAYVNAMANGTTEEQAAAQAFGDLKTLQAALFAYIGNARFYYITAPPPPEIAAGDLQVRELSEAEVDAYRGGFAAVRGRAQDAIPILEQAVKLDPKLALGYQYLGLAEFEDKKLAEALADFTRAIELNPKNALTRFLRAYLTSTQGGAVGNDEQMEEDLRTAIAVSPEFAPPYGVLAVYLANQGQNLPEALKLAQKAQALEPGNTSYQIDMALVLARMNHFTEARSIATHARANAANPGERAEAERFLTYLDQARQYSSNDSGAPEAAAVEKSSAKPTDPPPTIAPTPAASAGALREATGIVTKLSCMSGLKFELDTDAGTLTLHVKPGAQYQIQMKTRPSGPFNPCTAVQGQRVKVEYLPVGTSGKIGEVESLTVLGSASGDAANTGSVRHLGVGAEHGAPVTASAEGSVTQVQCNGNELTVNLDAGETAFILHARDATRVQFEQDVAFDAGDFQPCKQLSGRQVKITFVVVDGKTYDGEIQDVEVEK